jgi:hypothetical protein
MGALILQLEQTLLIYAGIPLAVIAIVAGMVYAGGRKTAKRYRPGRPYDHAPVWYTSSVHPAAIGEHREGAAAALPATPSTAVAATIGEPMSAPGVTGGASDRW